MRLVREVANRSRLYLLNSVNPFRLEGQKTIAFEMAQQRGGEAGPRGRARRQYGQFVGDRERLPRLLELGVITKMPKITIVQAEGSNPLYRMWARATTLRKRI